MPESLLTPSQIKLFGRPFAGLTLTPLTLGDVDPNRVKAAAESDTKTEPNDSVDKPCDPAVNAVEYDLLANQIIRKDSRLARIYGYTHEGHYYDLPQPAVFLVHGEGRRVAKALAGMLDRSGVAARDWVFEEDARYWEYDRVNYSLRIDINSGPLHDILLAASEEAGGEMSSRSHMASRSDLSSRSHLSSRSDLSARSHMSARHRIG